MKNLIILFIMTINLFVYSEYAWQKEERLQKEKEIQWTKDFIHKNSWDTPKYVEMLKKRKVIMLNKIKERKALGDKTYINNYSFSMNLILIYAMIYDYPNLLIKENSTSTLVVYPKGKKGGVELYLHNKKPYSIYKMIFHKGIFNMGNFPQRDVVKTIMKRYEIENMNAKSNYGKYVWFSRAIQNAYNGTYNYIGISHKYFFKIIVPGDYDEGKIIFTPIAKPSF